MLEIDGSYGESGGQVLRTALALAVFTKTSFRMTNIRKKRKVPGLSEQHIQAVKAAQQMCNAEVKGNSLRSIELTFIPQEVSASKNISVTIGTSGSVGLVLQSLMLPGMNENFSISIFGGGTYGEWAVPLGHVQNVIIPLLKKFGYNASIVVEKEGFYPKGGAFVKVETKKSKLRPIVLKQKIGYGTVQGFSISSDMLREKKVAERQAESARKYLQEKGFTKVNIQEKYVRTLSPGSAIQVWCEGKESMVEGDSLGAIKKSAETVGREAAERLVKATPYAVDVHTADQLIPFMGVAGSGELYVEEISEHTRTNVWVVEQFLPVKFELKEHMIICKSR